MHFCGLRPRMTRDIAKEQLDRLSIAMHVCGLSPRMTRDIANEHKCIAMHFCGLSPEMTGDVANEQCVHRHAFLWTESTDDG